MGSDIDNCEVFIKKVLSQIEVRMRLIQTHVDEINGLMYDFTEADPISRISVKKISDVFELSVRTANALKNNKVFLVGQLIQMGDGDLMGLYGFGRKSLNEVKEVLEKHEPSLQLYMKLSPLVASRIANRVKQHKEHR